MKKFIAQVIVDNKTSNTDKPYTYLIKEEMLEDIREGMRVVVPFGMGNRLIKGIVINIEEYEKEFTKFKYIEDVLDDKPIISKEMIDLSFWMRDYYLSSYLDALHLVMPPGNIKEINTYISLKEGWKEKTGDLGPKEKEIFDILIRNDGISFENLKKLIKDKNLRRKVISLEEKGLIRTTLEIDTKIRKKYERYVHLCNKGISLDELLLDIDKRANKQIEILEFLYNIDEITMKELLRETNTSSSVVKTLEKKGKVVIYEKEVLRDPIPDDICKYKKHELTKQQKYCVETIYSDIKKEKCDKFLIHGVTGSGKTEVYLQLIEKIIASGKEAIVLVPEISLTPQTVERFVGRFGDNVAVLHSKLSNGERFDEWRRIKEGKVKIAVGARSAVFAPFNNLGIIIIDEEHENSYKSSMNPKYDAIKIAEKRCEIERASLVLGTATPSIETYYRAKSSEIKLLTLDERINNKNLPMMSIIDMREELDKGNKSILSIELYKAIEENLKNKKQTILFLNRRGYSTFVSCRKCGYVVKCDNCDVSMTYHFNENKLKCHYCGMSLKPPEVCPKCGSKYIKYFGIGTEKIEETIKNYFPQARVARMDLDTTSKKNGHIKILNRMKKGEIDILIGTQMITKGLDFPLVTLVGIIAADTSLNLPDFRSAERTFQLLTQVGGRAGRGDFEGKVIIQTYNPSHFSIQMAKNYEYNTFYETEIMMRKEFNYPPFIDILNIVIYGVEEERVISSAKKVYKDILSQLEKESRHDLVENIFGPNPAPLEKLKNNYRWQILFKCNKNDLDMLKGVIKRVCIDNSQSKHYKGIKFNIDVNPNSIL